MKNLSVAVALSVAWCGAFLIVQQNPLLVAPVYASAEVMTLSPSREFDIPADFDHLVQSFLATRSELVFLVRAQSSTNGSEVVKTDFYGRLVNRIPLPDLSIPPIALRYHPEKGYAILFQNPAGSGRVLLLAHDGSVVNQVVSASACFNIAFCGDTLVGMNYTSLFVIDGPAFAGGLSRLDHHLNSYYEFAQLSDASAVLVGLEEGTLKIVDRTSLKTQTILPSAPEIVRQAPVSSNMARPVVFSPAVFATADRLYLGITGFQHPLSKGAVAVALSFDGTVQESLRFLLPRFDGRYLTPDRLVVVDRTVYWAWSRNKRVAVYDLP
jgi:hypothetical protein